MQKITPHLWFDKEAKEAAEFYVTVFPESKIKNRTTLHNTPSGTADILTIDLLGHEFTLISAGPYFKINPSISFLIACDKKEDVDMLWQKLSMNGTTLMELGSYPFSGRYGWIQDRHGVSWQIMLTDKNKTMQRVTPTLMFTGSVCGKAEEAIKYYVSMFEKSKIGDIMRYGKNQEPDKEGTMMHASFILEEQEFAAMDSALEHKFAFNEGISLIVHCESQEEIDYYWRLSAAPASEQCGWLKDKYGLSWQIVPTVLGQMLSDKDEKKVARVTEAFLKMKKFDFSELKKAYDNSA